MRNKIIISVFIGLLLFGCVRKECEPVLVENLNGGNVKESFDRIYKITVIQERSSIGDTYVDGHPQNQNLNYNDGLTIYTSAWTFGGIFGDINGFIKFRYPEKIIKDNVKWAKLTLFADTTKKWNTDPNAEPTKGHYVSDTSFRLVIKKVLGSWKASILNYNNQPAVSETNKVAQKLTTVNSQSYSFDVTEIVKDQLGTSNNGFFLCLSNYSNYTRVCFYSSQQSKYPSLYPKLEIGYWE